MLGLPLLLSVTHPTESAGDKWHPAGSGNNVTKECHPMGKSAVCLASREVLTFETLLLEKSYINEKIMSTA
jgi:hypothetical protein